MATDTSPGDDAAAADHAESYASALAVMPRVVGLTGARSVVVVGAGSGAWSMACREVGVPEVVGVDGGGVPAEHRGRGTEFIEHDLAEPLRLDRWFGLTICVGVAEHLAPERAPGLVADVTALAPVVLFAAAVPGQTGVDHGNEQWSEYWVALFEAEGWSCRDAIRPWVRTNEDVAWWFRQSLFLAVAPSDEHAYSSFPRLAAVRTEHPVDYLVRPAGDVMTPPPPPEPEPAAEPEPVPEPEPERPAAPEPAPLVADRPDVTAEDDGTTETAAPANGDTGDDMSFPEPPGWAALRRVAGRARRRSGR